MMKPVPAYDSLKIRFSRIQKLRNAISILNKDMTATMPPGAADDRAGQMVALSESAHELLVAPQTAQDLADAEAGAAAFTAWDRANLAEMRRLYGRAAGVPATLMAEKTRLSAIGEQNHSAWKRHNDWAAARPHLESAFTVLRAIGQAQQEALGTATAYDAMIDEFDPGNTAAQIEALFAPVEQYLRTAIPLAAARHSGTAPAGVRIPLPPQEGILRAIAGSFGFDFSRGLFYILDQHPSCYGTPDDQRFTVRADEDSFPHTVQTLAHEAGHGIYEQNLPAAWRYQPVGESNGMTIHESQSLFWERHVTRGAAFQRYLSPLAVTAFGCRAEDIAYPLHVEPDFIRIDADEMTYPMHVFLRFDLEKRLMDGSLAVKDLPEAWAEGMRARLGIVPPDHAHGCLQDIHWPALLVGYFPEYSLGAMTAAQLDAAMRRAIPDADARIEKGDFHALRAWLTDKVHSQGRLHKPMELIRHATGEALNPAYFIDHLDRRYMRA